MRRAMYLALATACFSAPVWPQAAAPAKREPARQTAPAAIPSYRDLKFPPLRPVQIPKVESFTLANGMRVYLLEDHELPLISGTALVRVGNLFDPADKVGLATITGMVMRTGGTKSKTGDQLDVELENIAAGVESDIGETSGRVAFSCLKENVDEVLGIFHDLLTGPEFRQDKIDLAKTELRGSIARRNDDPGGIAAREFANNVYGRNTPYGWMMEYATVDRIQRDDLVAFYKRYFFPANIMLAVYGDFSAPEMRARLEKVLGGWTYTQPAAQQFVPVVDTPRPGVFLAVKKDVSQTFFEVGHLGGVLRDKDYPALEVMGDILGGGFRSRLFQKVRTQLGLAYSISADWGANYDHAGLFRVSGSTKSASTVEALKAVREEIGRIRSTEVSEEELKAAKDSVLNGFVFNFDTRAKTLNRILRYEYFGYPRDFIFEYQKAIAAVTRADVLRVAREHLHPQNLAIVAVGNPDEFGQPLASLGLPVTPIDLTIPESKPAAAAVSPGSIEKGRELLRKAQQAVGGADKLAAIRDMTTSAELVIVRGGMKAKQTNRWVASGSLRQDSELPFGKIAAFSDGKSGWFVSPQGAVPLPAAMLKQVQGELLRMYPNLLLSDRVAGRTVSLAGPGTVEISAEGTIVKLTVDEATGLPLKQSYQQVAMGGPPATVEEVFSDFREVNGVKVPFKVVVNQNGSAFAEATVLDLKMNTGVTLEEISKKP